MAKYTRPSSHAQQLREYYANVLQFGWRLGYTQADEERARKHLAKRSSLRT